MSTAASLPAALSEWSALLGPERVSTSKDLLERYARSDLQGHPPLAALRPQQREQVAAIVQIANRHGLPLYAISRGENWGYGAASPVLDGQVLLDLRDLNRILEVNEELSYCVVEPGVTQQQLVEHLEQLGGRLTPDCTDAPGTTSVMGNMLERGIGFSSLGDRYANACGLEVVLADGSTITTGFGPHGSELTHLRKHGLGPALEGIFTQSNLGIVVSMGVWLMPRPEAITAYWLLTPDDGQVAKLMTTMRDLRLRDGVQTLTRAVNLARGTQRSQMWAVLGAFYGTRAYVDHCEKATRARVEGLCRPFFSPLNDPAWRPAARQFLESLYPDEADLRVCFHRLNDFATVLGGRPLGTSLLNSGHAALEDPQTPARSHVTLSPCCPATEKDVSELIAMLRAGVRSHQVTAAIHLVMVDARSVVVSAHLLYETANAAEKERVRACHVALREGVERRGWSFYRLGIQDMPPLTERANAHWELVAKLKAALDPRDTLAPGRYARPAVGGPK